MRRNYLIPPRHFIAWREPGGEELGRVQLLPTGNLSDVDPQHARLAERADIPAGSILMFVVEDPDESLS